MKKLHLIIICCLHKNVEYVLFVLKNSGKNKTVIAETKINDVRSEVGRAGVDNFLPIDNVHWIFSNERKRRKHGIFSQPGCAY